MLQNENGVVYVGNWAVGYTDGLFDADLRTGTIGIAEDAFSYCRMLKTANIPDSVTYIEGKTLYILCTQTTFSLPVQWKDATGTGKFSGEVSLTENFYTSIPMTDPKHYISVSLPMLTVNWRISVFGLPLSGNM